LKDLPELKDLKSYIQKGLNEKSNINLKEELIKSSSFSIEGANLQINNLTKNLNNLIILKLLSKNDNSDLPYYNDIYEKENICYNFTQEMFNNLNNIKELTLKFLSLEQFLLLTNSLNDKGNKSKSELSKIDLDIDYSYSKLINEEMSKKKGDINYLNKNLILKAINLLISYSYRISKIREFNITLINHNPKSSFILSIENGLYFIDLSLNKLKYCYNFGLINNNYNYYPKDEEKPETTLTGSGRRTRKNIKKKEPEDFYLNENIHKCHCEWNYNNEIFVCYIGTEMNDYIQFDDIDNFLIFLYVVETKFKQLNKKPILSKLKKFFCSTKIKNMKVCNLNN
jgi:hypothetical protein